MQQLPLLRHHYHPSVQAFAGALCDRGGGHAVSYDGDPLVDFALMPFLDKVVYKQGKAAPKRHGPPRFICRPPGASGVSDIRPPPSSI